MTNYKASIVRLKNVRPHPNADRLQLSTVQGNQIVTGLEEKKGDIGVYFPVDSALSPEFLDANDLVARHDPETGNKLNNGYFSANGRVKVARLRGEKSEGIWLPLDSIYNLKPDLPKGWVDLKEGMELDEVQGVPLCSKYITPATKAAMRNNSALPSNSYFHRHFDTEHLGRNMRDIPDGARLIITEKMEGTSFRFGFLPQEKKLSLWEKILSKFGAEFQDKYSHLIGTRNMIQGSAENFGGEQYRYDAIESLIGNLHKGETIFGEIVGYEETGKSIMPKVETFVLPKETRKEFDLPSEMNFSYGCHPFTETYWSHETGEENRVQNKIFVYRITQQNQDGDLIELTWDQVEGRCRQLGVETVPVLDKTLFFGKYPVGDVIINADGLLHYAGDLVKGLSTQDHHLKEGVVVRWENNGQMGALKEKSFEYKLLSGQIKSDESYVDTEEIA